MLDASPQATEQPQPRQLVTLKDLITHPKIAPLGISESYWMAAARDQKIPCLHIGIRTLFDPEKVYEVLFEQAGSTADFGERKPRGPRKAKAAAPAPNATEPRATTDMQ